MSFHQTQEISQEINNVGTSIDHIIENSNYDALLNMKKKIEEQIKKLGKKDDNDQGNFGPEKKQNKMLFMSSSSAKTKADPNDDLESDKKNCSQNNISQNVILKYKGDYEKSKPEMAKLFKKTIKLSSNSDYFTILANFEKRTKWNINSKKLKISNCLLISAKARMAKDRINYKAPYYQPLFYASSDNISDEFSFKFWLKLEQSKLDYFCRLLKSIIEDKEWHKSNEDVLENAFSVILAPCKELKKLGLNTHLKGQVAGVDLIFKPDFYFVFRNILYVFEFKYRPDRKNEHINAYNCALFKQIHTRLFRYLKQNDQEWVDGIEYVFVGGLALEENSKITLACQVIHISQLQFVDTPEFLKGLNLLKKRFKTSSNFDLKKYLKQKTVDHEWHKALLGISSENDPEDQFFLDLNHPEAITRVEFNEKEEMMFECRFKKRADGTVPNNAILPMHRLIERFPEIIIRYFNSKIKIIDKKEKNK
jgi:hypothetical protein